MQYADDILNALSKTDNSGACYENGPALVDEQLPQSCNDDANEFVAFTSGYVALLYWLYTIMR